MKTSSIHKFILAAVLLMAGISSPLQAQDHEAEMIAAAEALDVSFAAAVNAGDSEALAALYWNSPDLVSMPPDAMVFRGFEEASAGMVAFIERTKGAKLTLIESHHMVAGDLVLTWGLFTMTVPMPDGEMMEMSGRFSDAKAEKDGKWVYIFDHASVPMPPPPAPSLGY